MTVRRGAINLIALVLFVAAAILLRGQTIGVWTVLNPDEAELMAQARAAILSPVPYSTWTMGTTGPIWVLFLALLGAAGFPLTIASAHLLAAVLVGLMGFVTWLMLCRTFGLVPGIALSILWWLPIELIYPVGGRTDFGALNTELLPTIMVLLAALVPLKTLAAKPALFVVVGLLSGLAIGAKYQVIPVAIALLAVRLIESPMSTFARIRSAGLWVSGAALPAVLVVLAMTTSPRNTFELAGQNISFIASYVGRTDLLSGLANSSRLLGTQPYFIGATLGLLWFSYRSTRRILIGRWVLAAAGLAAVYGSGMAFPHYLILLYGAFGIALALPVRPTAALLPSRRWRVPSVAALATFAVALFTVGAVAGKLTLSSPSAVAATLSRQSELKQESLATLCPENSRVVVWGWAPELYVNYSWRSEIPYFNVLAITATPDLLKAGHQRVLDGIIKSDCVIDAVGSPFFWFGTAGSLTSYYPDTRAELDADFQQVDGALDCAECRVYVRR